LAASEFLTNAILTASTDPRESGPTDVAWRDRSLGRHLDDGIVRIGASVDQVDDAVERVS
jgi:hypothetical protein